MNFLLKKVLSALFLPLPLALVLLLLGLFMLLICQQCRAGKILLLLGLVILLAFSTPLLPNWMLKKLEFQYKPLTIPPKVNTIVVLGAGNGGYTHYPANNNLTSASLARLIEGIRLHKLLPNSKLILSGGRVFGSPPDSEAMNNVATMLGLLPAEIGIENGSEDTVQEAINLKKILRDQPFILVTSAYHMPRAMALFSHQGMKPIAAPTQLLLGRNRYTVQHYFPNSTYLLYSDIALHEYFGIAWGRLKKDL